MPTYDYRCPDCGNTETRLVLAKDRDFQVCHKCPKFYPDAGSWDGVKASKSERAMKRLPSAPSFVIK